MTSRQVNSQRIHFLSFGLISLIFISKISFAFLQFLPRTLSPFILQTGLHPFMNAALTGLLSIPLIIMWRSSPYLVEQKRGFKFLIFSLLSGVFFLSILQIFIANEGSQLVDLTVVIGQFFLLIIVFSRVLPTVLPLDKILKWIFSWSAVLVLLSFICFLVFASTSYKGGRFIGIFKHIPFMVSTSSVAFILGFHYWKKSLSLLHKISLFLIQALSVVTLVLTGTRSALFACAVAAVLFFILSPATQNSVKLFKFIFIMVAATVLIFFGESMFNWSEDIIRGRQNLAGRAAQDGIESRQEEVTRGWEYFQESPYVGHGLLAKFEGGIDADAGGYNSFKDPHNFFVSAAVVGGVPLLGLSILGFLLLVYGCLKGLMSKNENLRVIAIYLAVQVPILLIYHQHFSIGGMADRIYWLFFGCLAIKYDHNQK